MNQFAHMASKSQALIAEKMMNEIKDVIYSYSGEVPLLLAIGVLRLTEREILNEADD